MITTKLLKIQQQGITLKKDGLNPHFKSQYVTLNEVLDKVKKPLNDEKIVIVQSVEATGLRTTLIDTEDESVVESFVPFVGAIDMQKLGGAITYARRYSLIALLALEDEDDDGEKASAPKKATKGGVVDQEEEPFKI